MPNLYPLHVEVNEENILKLQDVLKKSYTEIVKEITTATDFGVANRRAILAQIRNILEETGVKFDEFISGEITNYYEIGAKDAVSQLKNIGADVPVSTGFNRIHKQAILALVDDTNTAFGESLNGINRSARFLLGKATRDLLTEKLAQGVISGSAMKEVKGNLIAILQEQGLDAMIDKGGKRWSLDTYTEMLFRTKAVEARNRGLANRMVENNYDLVQVSNHNSSHQECAVWESQILSLTGDTPGYPTVDEAESEGLFHPNCEHAINVLIPRLATATEAYNPDERTKLLSEEQIATLSKLK
jgi:hypothetical protein